jgi:hypothetical protein
MLNILPLHIFAIFPNAFILYLSTLFCVPVYSAVAGFLAVWLLNLAMGNINNAQECWRIAYVPLLIAPGAVWKPSPYSSLCSLFSFWLLFLFCALQTRPSI